MNVFFLQKTPEKDIAALVETTDDALSMKIADLPSLIRVKAIIVVSLKEGIEAWTQ